MPEKTPKHDDLQPLSKTQIAQIEEYIAKLERQHKSLWDIPEGEELSWEMCITPELVILYCDGVEDYNPWYEAWPVGPGESPFGTAIVPPLLLGYWQKYFHRQARGSGEVGGVAAEWDTEIIAPCPVGTVVKYRAKQARRYIRRGRQYVRSEVTVEDAKTGQLYVRHAREALAKYAKVEYGDKMAVATKDTPVGYELDGVKKQAVIQLMGSRHWGRANPNHWDPIFAAKCGLKGPIQTGQMSSAYLFEMCVNFFGENMFRNARISGKYIKPIYAGEIITTHGIVREKTPEGNGQQFKVEVWADNQDGEVKTIGWVEAHVE